LLVTLVETGLSLGAAICFGDEFEDRFESRFEVCFGGDCCCKLGVEEPLLAVIVVEESGG